MNIAGIQKTTTEAPARQSALSRVRKGPIRAPLRVLGYGSEGVGKSTFATGAPRPKPTRPARLHPIRAGSTAT